MFVLMRLIPGDPVLIMLGDEFTPDAYAELKAELGLDRSWVTQYVIWMGNVLRGDLGYSYIKPRQAASWPP